MLLLSIITGLAFCCLPGAYPLLILLLAVLPSVLLAAASLVFVTYRYVAFVTPYELWRIGFPIDVSLLWAIIQPRQALDCVAC